jgi:phage protein D
MAGANGVVDKAVFPARPSISVGGRDDPALAAGLLSLEVTETLQGLYRCEATFGNWGKLPGGGIGFLYFDRKTLDFGKAFAVKVGSDTLFDGRVMGLEAVFPEGRSAELVVLAEDRLQDLRMTRRTRTFLDATDEDVVRQVAADHGLTPDVKVPGTKQRAIAQVNQSDLAFLRGRLRAVDAEVWAEGSTLHARVRASRDGGTVALDYQGKLREFYVLADLSGQRTAVTVGGWDVAAKAPAKYEATAAVLGSEAAGGDSGPAVLKAGLGERKEVIAHTVPFDAARAQAEAEAYFRMAARRFVIGHAVAQPSPKVRVGARVNLTRLGPLFSGTYYVTEARHVFDGEGGLHTEFTAERPVLGRP